MKRLVTLLCVIVTFSHARGDDYVENYNMISDNYVDSIQDVQIVRAINGGTIITPSFDSSCPEEMILIRTQ